MSPYRSDLDAAQARIASLEAAVRNVETERARLERALREKIERRWPWSVLTLVAISGAALVVLVSLTPAAPAVLRPRTAAPAPSMPAPSDVQPQPASVLDAPSLAPTDEIAAMTPADSAFVSQYWEARVTRTGAHGPPVGTECLITTAPGLYGGAGIATVRCGEDLLHATGVTPPERGDERGFCWFDGRDLYCAPPDQSAARMCWINTAGHVASCHREIDLYVHSNMRDPRERPPPELL
jgi:hypothetical protein